MPKRSTTTTVQFNPLEWWDAQNRCLYLAVGHLDAVFRPLLRGEVRELALGDQRWASELVRMTDHLLDDIAETMEHPGLAGCDQDDVRRAAKDTTTLAAWREHLRRVVNEAHRGDPLA